MLIAEYSYETDIKVQRREAYREGLAEGIEQGIEQGAEQTKIETAKEALKNNISIETTAKITGLPIASVEKLKVEIEQNLQ
jgi:predicted transposase/invertase (TIGR01784 family)